MIIDCDFLCNTEFGALCTLTNEQCNSKECEFFKNGVGRDDLCGSLIGIDVYGNPIYSE